ncbi:hypothetical protein GRS96_06130 [Rathayibacter sp. VKM Ac-2803]|uniref:Dyp-type peroxidase domain-containing protein n=1 Tax=Rathayibacter sp. VKM Ac-2803 TaxID=2609256 RepID=UPI00135BD425|nr:Dyp-type peroxidase domain-containing protein [Rathayibacter sp. VKM Ac-2803]MWV48854.1 hypothetical protein [Rathayibacter sp. VKM Ac-2803]
MSADDRVPIEPQAVVAPLSRSAVFLSVDIVGGQDAADRVRDVIADVGGLLRAVGFRDLGGRLSCLVGVVSDAWDRFGSATRPQRLHDFQEVAGAVHTACRDRSAGVAVALPTVDGIVRAGTPDQASSAHFGRTQWQV